MRKKVFSALMALALFISYLPAFALAAEAPQINAKGAIVGEMTTDTIIFEQNADEKLFPASTTKIMTAILAIENCEPDEIITVSESSIAGLSEMGSSILLQDGEQMRFTDMLQYLLIASGNDAANALAVHISGSVDAFVELMNAKAAELGCTNTHFANPHGLHDENHYTTPRDLLKIAEYAMKNSTFAETVKIDRTVLPATNKRGEQTITSTNHLISRWRNRDYYYEGALGIKTGFTTPAGYCLVSGVNSGELTYITVVMGASQSEDGVIGSFTETRKLLDYAKKGFSVQTIVQAGSPVTEAPVALGKDTDTVILGPESDITALLPTDFDPQQVQVTHVVEENIKAPIEKGQVLGSAEYSYDGQILATGPLVASDSVRRSLWLFIFDGVFGIFGGTAAKIIIGAAVLAVLLFFIYGTLNRKRRRRRGRRRQVSSMSSYKGRRR